MKKPELLSTTFPRFQSVLYDNSQLPALQHSGPRFYFLRQTNTRLIFLNKDPDSDESTDNSEICGEEGRPKKGLSR